MRLAHLIAQYRLTEIRLRQAITLGSPAERAAELLRACAERMDRLEGFEPQTPSELRRLTFFFLRRAALISSAQPVNRELDVALELLNRYSGSWPVPFEAPNDDGTPMSDDGAPAREIPATMTHYVSNAFELITAVDFNFRVLAASEPFARHLGISRSEMVSRPLPPLLDRAGFADCRPLLDGCLSGRMQEFELRAQCCHGTRRLRCQMRPVRDEWGTVLCALIYFDDVEGLPGRAPEDMAGPTAR